METEKTVFVLAHQVVDLEVHFRFMMTMVVLMKVCWGHNFLGDLCFFVVLMFLMVVLFGLFHMMFFVRELALG